jgi:hypothetical protein
MKDQRVSAPVCVGSAYNTKGQDVASALADADRPCTGQSFSCNAGTSEKTQLLRTVFFTLKVQRQWLVFLAFNALLGQMRSKSS